MAVDAAVIEFGRRGYEGTSTAAIAARVGVSQPYLFRLFPTKRELFLAAADRCFSELEDRLRDGAEGRTGREGLTGMADAYRRILREDSDLLRLQLQIYAAALDDDEIARMGHARWARLWRLIGHVTAVPQEEVLRFMSIGLLTNVLTAFGIPHTPGTELAGSLAAWAEGTAGSHLNGVGVELVGPRPSQEEGQRQ